MGIFKMLKDAVGKKIDDAKAELKLVTEKKEKPAFDPLKQNIGASMEKAGLRQVSQAEVRAEAAKKGLLPGMDADGIQVEIHNHNDLYLYIDGPKATFQVGGQSLSGSYLVGTKFYVDKNGRPGRFLYEVTEHSGDNPVYLK